MLTGRHSLVFHFIVLEQTYTLFSAYTARAGGRHGKQRSAPPNVSVEVDIITATQIFWDASSALLGPPVHNRYQEILTWGFTPTNIFTITLSLLQALFIFWLFCTRKRRSASRLAQPKRPVLAAWNRFAAADWNGFAAADWRGFVAAD